MELSFFNAKNTLQKCCLKGMVTTTRLFHLFLSWFFCLFVSLVEMYVSKAGRRLFVFRYLDLSIMWFFVHLITFKSLFVPLFNFIFKLQKFQRNKFRLFANVDYYLCSRNRLEYRLMFCSVFFIKAHWLRYIIYTFCWYFQWYHNLII